MRLMLACAALAALLSAAPATASPGDEVTRAVEKLAGAGSYVIHIDAPQAAAGGQIEMQYVAPDRYRMMMPGMPAQTIIGNQVYMDMGGRVMRVPLPTGTLDQMRDQAHIRQTQENARIEAAGSDVIDGSPASKYRIIHPDQPGTEVMLWVGSNGWPVKMQVEGGEGAATMRYSRFNDASLVIQPPD